MPEASSSSAEMPAASSSRAEGERAPRTPRGLPDLNLPPGCKSNFGVPSNANPFVQVKLPQSFTQMGRSSRAMSYRDPNAPEVMGGTHRSLAVAKHSCETWAWEWFENLPQKEQDSLREKYDVLVQERPQKKQRT